MQINEEGAFRPERPLFRVRRREYRPGMPPGDQPAYRRIAYVSAATGAADLDVLLAQARRNNGVNGVSGLLYADGRHYLQVLEGTPEAVEHVFRRISADPRHADVAILTDDLVDERAFGDWSMGNATDRTDPAVRDRLRSLLRSAPPAVRAVFADAL